MARGKNGCQASDLWRNVSCDFCCAFVASFIQTLYISIVSQEPDLLRNDSIAEEARKLVFAKAGPLSPSCEDGDRTIDISFFHREKAEAPVAPKAPACSYRMGPALPLHVPVTWVCIGGGANHAG